MKLLITILSLFISFKSFASHFADGLPGHYVSESCRLELDIVKEDDSLWFKSLEGSQWAIIQKVELNTQGRIFDCTPGGSYGRVECRIQNSETLLKSEQRGCLFFCGSWNLSLSAENLGESGISLKWDTNHDEACIFKRKK